MWVHAYPNILKNCRTSHLDPEEPEDAEDFDPEEAKKVMEAADPYEPRLKAITDDGQVKLSSSVKQNSWVIRMMGDATEYQNETDPKKIECNGVVVVRSLLWPGAYSFYYGERVLQVYLGNGHKHEQACCYFPLHPPMVQADPEEYPDGPEPTPLEEPPAEEQPEGEEGEEEQEENEDDE